MYTNEVDFYVAAAFYNVSVNYKQPTKDNVSYVNVYVNNNTAFLVSNNHVYDLLTNMQEVQGRISHVDWELSSGGDINSAITGTSSDVGGILALLNKGGLTPFELVTWGGVVFVVAVFAGLLLRDRKNAMMADNADRARARRRTSPPAVDLNPKGEIEQT